MLQSLIRFKKIEDDDCVTEKVLRFIIKESIVESNKCFAILSFIKLSNLDHLKYFFFSKSFKIC